MTELPMISLLKWLLLQSDHKAGLFAEEWAENHSLFPDYYPLDCTMAEWDAEFNEWVAHGE